MRRRTFFGLLGSTAFACSGPIGPEDPVWGKVPCSDCSMLVADKRFAAQSLDASGTRLFFDDVGCLAHWMNTHSGVEQRGWVRDVGGSTWLDVAVAHYAVGAQTPMDYGFAASAEHGELSFEDVKHAVAERAEKR